MPRGSRPRRPLRPGSCPFLVQAARAMKRKSPCDDAASQTRKKDEWKNVLFEPRKLGMKQ